MKHRMCKRALSLDIQRTCRRAIKRALEFRPIMLGRKSVRVRVAVYCGSKDGSSDLSKVKRAFVSESCHSTVETGSTEAKESSHREDGLNTQPRMKDHLLFLIYSGYFHVTGSSVARVAAFLLLGVCSLPTFSFRVSSPSSASPTR